MKVLTINCSNREYSTGHIKTSIEKELAPRGVVFYHCYEYDHAPQKNNGYEFLLSRNWLELHFSYNMSRLIGLQYGTDSIATFRLIRIISKVRPDVVHIHCPNSLTINLYRVLGYLKKNHYPTIITNHAEFFFTGNCPHAFDCDGYMDGCDNCSDFKSCGRSFFLNRLNEAWLKMKKSLNGFDRLCMVAVSPWQFERMKESTIASSLYCKCIINGLDTKIFYYRKNTLDLSRKYGSYILHVTSSFSERYDDQKGGRYILQLASVLMEIDSGIKVLVAGKNMLESECDLPHNVIILGEIKELDILARLYSNALATIITSCRETFGLPCAESLCCGTPVVGFRNGGSESIAIEEYTSFVEYGDAVALFESAYDWIKRSVNKELISKRAIEKYSNEVMAQRYFDLYNEML